MTQAVNASFGVQYGIFRRSPRRPSSGPLNVLVVMLLLIFMGSTSADLKNVSVFVDLGRQNRGVKCWYLSLALVIW